MEKGSFGDPKLALEMIMSEKDLDTRYVRSQGAGGQNVNKVNSAVQLKHLPTGLFVKVQDSRDQSQNRPIAMQRLQEKLLDHLGDWNAIIPKPTENEVNAENRENVGKPEEARVAPENEVMSKILKEVVESDKTITGVRARVLKKVVEDIRLGITLT